MSKRQPCPVDGCANMAADCLCTCRSCWRLVPASLRQSIRAAWKAVQSLPPASTTRGIAVRAYLTACEAAAASVKKESTHAH